MALLVVAGLVAVLLVVLVMAVGGDTLGCLLAARRLSSAQARPGRARILGRPWCGVRRQKGEP
jgi:hypothetical protein